MGRPNPSCSHTGDVSDIRHYIKLGPLRQAFAAAECHVHHPHRDAQLLDQVLIKFYWLPEQSDLRKKPSTAKLVDWISALLHSGIEKVEAHIPFVGALLKKEQDVDALLKYDSQGGRYPKSWQNLGLRYNQYRALSFVVFVRTTN